MKSGKILFLSNGHGEDAIAVSIVNAFRKIAPQADILAVPLVGKGSAYSNAGIEITGPLVNMPSGGLIYNDISANLKKDIKGGLLKLTYQQIKLLRDMRDEIRVVAAVGDLYPVLLGGLFVKKPVIFVGTAKSSYYDPYSPLEAAVFRRYAKMTFPRDSLTARALEKLGVRARWVGNAMMDCLDFTGEYFDISPRDRVIALLPGSRDFAYGDFSTICDGINIIRKKSEENFRYLVTLAGSIDVEKLAESSAGAGFRLKSAPEGGVIVAYLVNDKNGVEMALVKSHFADAINRADLVIGQAGTGNEQAAGLGKPVVAFDSQGREKLGWYRARQKGLLGDALRVVEKRGESVAEATLEIFNSQEIYDKMARVGFERLGPPGGAVKMAEFIWNFVSEGS